MSTLSHQLRRMSSSGSITNLDLNSNTENDTSPLRQTQTVKTKYYFFKVLQFLHFGVVMFYLWAGLVEFINNPPFFDAYGDALTNMNKLPEGIFANDPRQRQAGNLRLMDLPILLMLLAYAGVATWLKYQGLAWLLTFSITIAFIFFWVVNFWAQGAFDWRYYSSRMSGLELQVSALALSCTNILMVMFYKRRRLPFKFKSSLPIERLGFLHLSFNFCAIFLIMFTSMLMWFTKMYISWACFKDQNELLGLCQVTNQVQCYPCQTCTEEGINKCYKREIDETLFSCNTKYPKEAKKGAFCIFNYNMSTVEFLTIFAYIGGLCVFLSNFIKLVGHYILRVLFMFYEWCLNRCNRTSRMIDNHRQRLVQRRQLREHRMNCDRQLLTDSISPIQSPRELHNPVGSPGGSTNASGGLSPRLMDLEDGEVRHQNNFADSYRATSPSIFLDEDESDGNFLNASLG
ncbi:uncharacterized protein [Clytia hemisphaerica]|uniref:Uncharacterized protein n=1 Tax=Clytia hemisphaerica TaxID=252671 RepID=A0A7M5U2H0_9CNID